MHHMHARIRFQNFELTHSAADRCEARVELAWDDDQRFTGVAEAHDDAQMHLRCAAEATARALMAATSDRVQLEVLAVKAIEGFDTIIVIVSLSSRMKEHAERLVGSCLIKGDPARGAVLAVLSATNRLLGKVLTEVG